MHSLFSTYRQSSGRNIQHTHCFSLSFFSLGPSLCITDLRLRKRFVEWNWLLYGGSTVLESLISSTKSTLCSAHNDSLLAEIQHTGFPLPPLLWDQVFTSQIQTKVENCWLKLTPLWVNPLLAGGWIPYMLLKFLGVPWRLVTTQVCTEKQIVREE